jgi:hypothetical protein
MGAFYPPEVLRYIADRSDSYEEFCQLIESPAHNLVHNNIGGDMGTTVSPNDPLFFIHHAFIDLQWALWQERNSRYANDYGGVYSDGSRASRNDMLLPFNIRARDVLDTRRLCYVYDRMADGNNNNNERLSRRSSSLIDTTSSVAKLDIDTDTVCKVTSSIHLDYPGVNLDLSNIQVTNDTINEVMSKSRMLTTTELATDDITRISSLRSCAPLSIQMIREMCLNETFVRETEAILKKFTIELNNQKGYVSPAALINHPLPLMDIVANRTQVYVMEGRREAAVEVPRSSDGRVDIDALLVTAKTTLVALNKVEEKSTETVGISVVSNILHSAAGITNIL